MSDQSEKVRPLGETDASSLLGSHQTTSPPHSEQRAAASFYFLLGQSKWGACSQLKAFWLTGVTFRVWGQVTSSVKLTDWTETGRSFASKDGHGASELTLCFRLSCLAVIAFSTCLEPASDPEAKGPKAYRFNGTAGYKHMHPSQVMWFYLHADRCSDTSVWLFATFCCQGSQLTSWVRVTRIRFTFGFQRHRVLGTWIGVNAA